MATETARAARGAARAAEHRGPRRAAALHAAHARDRGARDDPVPPGQGPRLLLRRLRPGGGLRRRRLRHGRRRTGCASCTATSARTSSAASTRPASSRQYMGRAGGVTGGRDGNVHFGDPTLGLRRDGLDAARHDARRDRHGDGVPAARRAALRDHLVRRRLDLARRLPRGDELGRPCSACRSSSCSRTTSTPTPRRSTQQFAVDPVERAAAYGFPGVSRRRQRRRGDVRRACGAPASGRSAGDGPTLLEAVTMRMHGHAAHDDMSYVPEGAGRGVAPQATRSTARARGSRELGVDVDALRAEVDARRSTRPPRRRWRCRCPTRRPRPRASSPRRGGRLGDGERAVERLRRRPDDGRP